MIDNSKDKEHHTIFSSDHVPLISFSINQESQAFVFPDDYTYEEYLEILNFRYFMGMFGSSQNVQWLHSSALASYEEELLSQPTNETKGKRFGNCNRTACKKPHAIFYNISTRAYYCGPCAKLINKANSSEMGVNKLCVLEPISLKGKLS